MNHAQVSSEIGGMKYKPSQIVYTCICIRHWVAGISALDVSYPTNPRFDLFPKQLLSGSLAKMAGQDGSSQKPTQADRYRIFSHVGENKICGLSDYLPGGPSPAEHL